MNSILKEEEVQLHAYGTPIFGTFRKGEFEGEKGPAVLLIHGYSSFRDELTGFVELAELLSKNGISSLRIDMRGCGESPRRGELHPFPDWIVDSFAAISYLEGRGDVDNKRIGVIGMSVGGGTAIYAAALDKRVKAVVALAPVADGEWWLRNLWSKNRGMDSWKDFSLRVALDQRNQSLTGRSEWVHISEILAFQKDSDVGHAAIMKKYPQFLRLVPLSSAYSLFKFKPIDLVHKVSPCPLLIVHSVDDESVPVEQAKQLYANAGEIKELILVEGSPHCFWIGSRNKEVQSESLEWMKKYL
ncbi:MAG: alpha/beta hydrolase [Candidatus Bathyarchaeia archaeon]